MAMEESGDYRGGRAGRLVDMCIQAAAATSDSVERWRRQRRTLERLPSQLADALLRRLIRRRLLYPSLLEIFQHSVEEIDLTGDCAIDAEWLAYLGAFRFLHTLKLADCRGINNSSLWLIAGMSTLKELDLSRCSKIMDAGIKHVISIQTLEKLYLSETRLTTEGVFLLSVLKNLSHLDLGGISVTDKALSSLQVLTRLEHLDLWGSEVSDDGVLVLKSFPKLSFLNLAWTHVTRLPFLPSIKSLNMSNCTIHSIFDESLGVFASLSKLTLSGATFANIDEAFSYMEGSFTMLLDISGCSISSFYFLEKMKGLEHLNLCSSTITDATIDHVANVGTTLRHLNLNNTKVTSRGISMLVGNIMNLVYLSLANTGIDDSALLYVSMMPSLRTIDFSHTNLRGFTCSAGDISDRKPSLCLLRNLEYLESLNLEETQLKDEVLHPLALLQELKYLYLKGDFLSDVTLNALSSLSKLRVLGFRGAVLTNSGLLLYMPPATLRKFDLRGCWLLTEDAVLSFHRCHPMIEVRHELVEALHADLGVSVASAHQARPKAVKFSRPLKGLQKVTFADERIRYSQEELIELQHLLPSGSAHFLQLPAELQRMEGD